MSRNLTLSLYVIIILGAAVSCSSPGLKISPDEAVKIGTDAYIYGYPLVTNEINRRIYTNVKSPQGMYAPMGQFAHMNHLPTPADNGIMAPDDNSLYSGAWLDLSEEPYVLDLPDAGGRYYLMIIQDAWSNIIAVPGSRTNRGAARQFVISGPGWNGSLPAGTEEIKSPTDLVMISAKIYCDGSTEDIQQAGKLQEKYKLIPLNSFGKDYIPPSGMIDPSVKMNSFAREQVYTMKIDAYFNLLAELMKDNPPAAADKTILSQMARIGLVPGQPFNLSQLDTAAARALSKIPLTATRNILSSVGQLGKSENGWLFIPVRGNYNTNYLLRALVTETGLGTYFPQDLIFPIGKLDSDKNPLIGKEKYVLHFSKEDIPPVKAFWSLTMYDPKLSFVPNEQEQYSICSLSKLNYNKDGSLDIFIQKESPGKGKDSNWLPAPEGRFFLMMRLYWPDKEIINGSWKIPAIKKST